MFDLDSALGVEISRHRMSFCSVSKGLQGYTVKSTHVIEDLRELEPSELHARIKQFTRSNGFNRENIILGVPRDQVIVHTIELPLEVEENLDQVVQFQAAKLDPSEEESSYYDYVILERNEKEGSLLLQIVMIPKATLDQTLELFRDLNLYPLAIRVSSLGLQQLLRLHGDGFGDLPSLMINLDPDSLEIIVANGDRQCLPHKRELAPGEELSTELIWSELDAVISRLPLRLKGFRKVYLTGKLAEDFIEPLAQRLNEIELLKRRLKVRCNGKIRDDVLPALGLAVSGLNRSLYSRFNLIPKAKRLVGQRASLVPTIILVGLLIVLLALWSLRGFFQQQRLLESLDAELVRLQPRVEQALETRERWEEASQKAEELHAMFSGRQKVLELLRELTERIPEDAYLQNLIIQKNKVTVTGYAQNDASSLLTLLGQSDLIANAESRYITEDRTTRSQKFNFELTLRDEGEALP